MLKQVSLASFVAASTFTVLTKSKSPVLAEAVRPAAPAHGERLTSKGLNDRPGVLVWGSNRHHTLSSEKDLPVVRFPAHLEFFNGRLLRDLALSDDVAVAVLENGDVVEWGDGDGGSNQSATVDKPQLRLKGKNVVKVRVSGDKSVYALTNSGLIYSWPVNAAGKSSPGTGSAATESTHWCAYFSFLWGWGSGSGCRGRKSSVTALDTPSLSFREYVKDIEVGKDHILALTSNGRVFSGSTGTQRPKESKGQYGITTMSQFDEAPEPGKLHEIKLLKKFPVSQIAAGDYHSLVLTKEGKLLGFGDNVYGQLGITYSYRTANIAVPTELPISSALFAGDIQRKVLSIAAGGSVTYFTVNAGVESEDVYSMGNGLSGQLGTGSFANSQRSPLKVKHFSGLSQYSEKLGRTVPINVGSWSVGPTHTAVTLKSIDSSEGDVLIWGSNEFSQLGNGKRNIGGFPRSIPQYELDATSGLYSVSPISLQLQKGIKVEFKDEKSKVRKVKVDQVITCGENASAIYYRVAK